MPSASSSPIPAPRERIFSEPGDTGTLTADGLGGYLLTEADGTATDYNPNGTLNYIQDTNGNRITAGYTGGQLTSLTASSGPVDHHRLQRRRSDLDRDRFRRPDDHLYLRFTRISI